MISEVGCNLLASALSSNAGHLRELDLSYNNPGDSRVKLFSAKKEDPTFKLKYVLILPLSDTLYVGILIKRTSWHDTMIILVLLIAFMDKIFQYYKPL